MNDQPGNLITQLFAWLAAFAAGLGITTQDVVYMLFGALGLAISLASYITGRLDAQFRRKEDEKRTQMIRDYLDEMRTKPQPESSPAARVVADALEKAGE